MWILVGAHYFVPIDKKVSIVEHESGMVDMMVSSCCNTQLDRVNLHQNGRSVLPFGR